MILILLNPQNKETFGKVSTGLTISVLMFSLIGKFVCDTYIFDNLLTNMKRSRNM